ncbi:MAG: hypothetical protein JRI83_14000 [Deltaproteobacteria bacterium]|nr:hypothetical protein [Deltaproteobacteria bacterium]
MESSLFQIESLLWLLVAVAYIEAFRRLDRFVSRRKRPAHSESRVEADFKDYLVNGRLPHYVRDFIRKEKELGPRQ